MTRLAAHRLSVGLTRGWEGRIFRRESEHPAQANHPVVHVANFALPEDRGDFGGGVTDRMVGADVLIVLFEYGPESRGKPLFAHRGLPKLSVDMFSPARLQRTIPGQSGAQAFFTENGRPFCLYVVVADRRFVRTLVPHINAAIAEIEIERS